MENRSLEIAKIIQSQLMGQGKTAIVWSWGSHKYKVIENGLSFRVQGFLFTGEIRIILVESSDTYTIQLVKADKIQKTFTDVHVGEVIDLIDGQVEYTGANYANDVNNAVYKF